MPTTTQTTNENIDTLPEIARQYLMYLTTIKSSSKLTVREYIFDLRVFFRFMKTRKLKINDVPFDEIDVTGLDLDFMRTITKNLT